MVTPCIDRRGAAGFFFDFCILDSRVIDHGKCGLLLERDLRF